MSSKILICLTILFYTTDVTVGNKTIAICCNKIGSSSYCQSLDFVLNELLLDNSVLELTNGSCNLTHSLNFTRVSNITIRGQGSQYTNISCHHMNAGLVFNESSNIELRDFTINSCGVKINNNELINITGNASKSIVFMNTTNVVIQGLVVANSNGYGLMISDCFGSVFMNNTIFENNKVIESELEYTHGGGGLVITFMPLHLPLNASEYNIFNCKFLGNSGNIRLQNQTLKTLLHPYDSEKGGGIKFIALRNTSKINMTICDCFFRNNTGSYGGGLYIRIRDSTSECNITVSNSKFIENNGEVYGGGGANVGFNINTHYWHNNDFPYENTIRFDCVLFKQNNGLIGGGASVFTSSVEGVTSEKKNFVIFENCNFIENSANGGAAMDIRANDPMHLGAIFIAGVHLINVNFSANSPKELDEDEHTERAVFLTSEITVTFSGNIIFSDNSATALYSASALIEFNETTMVKFLNNTGERNGGAVLLAGDSRMQLGNNTYLEFVNNAATYGGAICALPTQVHGFTFTDQCFLNPSRKYLNIRLSFSGNSASIIGNDIFATSLDPCLGQCQFEVENKVNTSEIFSSDCIGHFRFEDESGKTPSGSISTCPKVINGPTATIYPIPGFPYNLNISQIDEMGNNVGDMFLLNVKLNKASNVSLGTLTLKNHTIFYGKPGESGILTVANSAQIIRQLKINFTLADCPPGFVLVDNKTCECSGNLKQPLKYRGITSCHNHSALVKPGYWVGYIGNDTEQTLFTGNCVVSFCNFNESQPAAGKHYLPKTNCTKEELEKTVCGSRRKGVLCTKCANGHTVFYHSPNLVCSQISKHASCSYGIPLYIVSELLPVTIIFLVILIFNISLTSGAVYSFVFYAQVLDSQFVDAFGTVDVNNPVTEFILNIFRVAYGSFNLNMLNIEELSFCLISDANVMDIFMFNYATILYAVMLVIVTVLILRHHSCYCCVKLGNRCGRRNIRGSIVDGLSAFLVLCYFQCIKITSKVLSSVTLTGKNGLENKSVPLFLGDSEYFGLEHLPYAIPAVFVLIVVIILPPCILMLEPVLTKLFSWKNCKVSSYYTKIRMSFMPFLDSFQGCFKDKYRFIAGLYFAYRVAASASYFTPSVFSCYACLEVILFLIVFIHVILRPHKESWHNIIEFFILINLLFVNTATIINLAIIQDKDDNSLNTMTIVWLQIVAMSMPIIYLAVYAAIAVYNRNIKQFFFKPPPISEQPLLDNIGLPARLLYNKEEDNF